MDHRVCTPEVDELGTDRMTETVAFETGLASKSPFFRGVISYPIDKFDGRSMKKPLKCTVLLSTKSLTMKPLEKILRT